MTTRTISNTYFDGKIYLTKNEVYIPPNDYVLKRVFYVMEGKITQMRFSENGDEFVQNIFIKGEFFNLRSMLNLVDSQTYLLSGSKGATITYITCEEIKEIQKRDNDFNKKIEKAFEANILNLEKRIEILACKCPYARVIIFINYLREKFGSDKFFHDYSQADIAKLTRLPRPQVSKILSQLRHKNLIEYNRKYMQVLTKKFS